ncbi:hypothetical protein ES705_03135 [subsurface metagenome]
MFHKGRFITGKNLMKLLVLIKIIVSLQTTIFGIEKTGYLYQ